MKLVLGNRTAISVATLEGEDGAPTREVTNLPPAKLATEVIFPDDWTPGQMVRALTDGDGVMANHYVDGPQADVPWVAVEGDGPLASLFAVLLGAEVRPYEENHDTGKGGGIGGIQSVLLTTALLGFALWSISRFGNYLKTNLGNDHQAKQMAGAASATAVAKWMALTATATAPAVTDTVLTGEITTGGGGLIRQAAAYAHTTSASTYTLTGTYTANGSDTLPVTIAQMGVFDATSSGNLVFRTLISPTATLSASGDVLTVTQTVTM